MKNSDVSQLKKIFVFYDSITFISLQRKYVIYKRKLCVMIKLIMKYDYFAKHLYNTAVIHTDHKFLIHFFIFVNDNHENIYEHWTKQFRRLNVEIKYISEFKNKVADEFFRIFFHFVDCEKRFEIKKYFDQLKKWIWSDRKKIKYEYLLTELILSKRDEMLNQKTFHEKSVFAMEIVNIKKNVSWAAVYAFSYWYEKVYRFLKKNKNSNFETFQKIRSYRVDSDIKILWIIIRKRVLFCIFEIKILRVLKNIHDKKNHWKKRNIN